MIALSKFGIGALLQASLVWLTVLKWVGGAYLIWLCIQVWRSPPLGLEVQCAAHRISPWLKRVGRRFNQACGGVFLLIGAALPLRA